MTDRTTEKLPESEDCIKEATDMRPVKEASVGKGVAKEAKSPPVKGFPFICVSLQENISHCVEL